MNLKSGKPFERLPSVLSIISHYYYTTTTLLVIHTLTTSHSSFFYILIITALNNTPGLVNITDYSNDDGNNDNYYFPQT